MGKCVPGMPCYGNGVIVYTTYSKGCTTTEESPYTLPLSSENVYYAGSNLPYTGIQTEDTLTDALQKIDDTIGGLITADSVMTSISSFSEEQKQALADLLAPYLP